MRRVGLWLGCFVAVLGACGQSSTTPDAAAPAGDATAGDGSLPDAASATVEIGTGADMFEPIAEGQEVEIILGPQGGGRNRGYHIWHALRARGVEPGGAEATFRTYLAADRSEVATQTRRVDLQSLGGALVFFGAAPQIEDCCLVEGQDLIMRVELLDANGLALSDERRVRASPACSDGVTGASICP
ncbi:MAG: hypothetical protein IT384_05165 [Deltaproteobacteria bacterium]|nr:hypothetical protein [Deltaproteobacteria bacterium]